MSKLCEKMNERSVKKLIVVLVESEFNYLQFVKKNDKMKAIKRLIKGYQFRKNS